VTPWGGDAPAAPLQEPGATASCVSRRRGRPCNTARPGGMTLCETSIRPGHARKEHSTRRDRFEARVIAADIRLMAHSWANMNSNPKAGLEVGTIYYYIYI
jgi:hypothetical protein